VRLLSVKNSHLLHHKLLLLRQSANKSRSGKLRVSCHFSMTSQASPELPLVLRKSIQLLQDHLRRQFLPSRSTNRRVMELSLRHHIFAVNRLWVICVGFPHRSHDLLLHLSLLQDSMKPLTPLAPKLKLSLVNKQDLLGMPTPLPIVITIPINLTRCSISRDLQPVLLR